MASKEITALGDRIKALPAAELWELVRLVENRFGVTAEEAARELTAETYDVIIQKPGAQTFSVVQDYTGRSRENAESFLKNCPRTLAHRISKSLADSLAKDLSASGATAASVPSDEAAESKTIFQS